MALTTAEKNVNATAQAARLAFLSLHTADPGATGASEVTGGSPAYARKALTPGAPAAGVVTYGQVSFDAPAGTYTHVGVWSAVTGGTFLGSAPITPTAQVLASQGKVEHTLTLTVS